MRLRLNAILPISVIIDFQLTSFHFIEFQKLTYLNYIYSNIANNQLRKQIADYFGVKPIVFVSWLTVLSNLRNMCCHHARVWNREFALKPAEALKLKGAWVDTSKLDNKRVYYRLCIVKYLLNIISPYNDKCD